MNSNEIIRLVAEMRHLQREYFRTRSESTLADAKRAEKKVDAWLTEHARGPTLFDSREGNSGEDRTHAS